MSDKRDHVDDLFRDDDYGRAWRAEPVLMAPETMLHVIANMASLMPAGKPFCAPCFQVLVLQPLITASVGPLRGSAVRPRKFTDTQVVEEFNVEELVEIGKYLREPRPTPT